MKLYIVLCTLVSLQLTAVAHDADAKPPSTSVIRESTDAPHEIRHRLKLKSSKLRSHRKLLEPREHIDVAKAAPAPLDRTSEAFPVPPKQSHGAPSASNSSKSSMPSDIPAATVHENLKTRGSDQDTAPQSSSIEAFANAVHDDIREFRSMRKNEGETAVSTQSVSAESTFADPVCQDFPKGWADKKGNDCEDYKEGEFCNRHGGPGDAWLDEWGSFEDVATDGKTAKDVCCVCGGGQRGDQPPVFTVAAGPAPAPGPAPAILGGKVGRELQEQGFHGELVEHKDMDTMTSDWGKEFGGHKSIRQICEESPGNEWCELHGYYDKADKSSAPGHSITALIGLLVVAFCMQLEL